ncbi:unnamed protein product, partial [Staurois parvus]
MALGRKGSTSGEIKGLSVCCVCCFTVLSVCVLLCKHDALYCSAMQSNTKQHAGDDRRDLRCLHTDLFPVSDTRRSPGAGEKS